MRKDLAEIDPDLKRIAVYRLAVEGAHIPAPLKDHFESERIKNIKLKNNVRKLNKVVAVLQKKYIETKEQNVSLTNLVNSLTEQVSILKGANKALGLDVKNLKKDTGELRHGKKG